MNTLFEKKKSMTFETCLVFMLYVDYGFNNNNKHTFALIINICPWLEYYKLENNKFKVHLEQIKMCY